MYYRGWILVVVSCAAALAGIWCLRVYSNHSVFDSSLLLQAQSVKREHSLIDLNFSSPARTPTVPTGPKDQRYLDHEWSTAVFSKVFDSQEFVPSVGAAEFLTRPKSAQRPPVAWMERKARLRSNLTESGFNTIGFSDTKGESPFLTSLSFNEIYETALNGPFPRCLHKASERPVVDMGLVVPIGAGRYDETWALLEAIRQLTVFPREIVFVIGGVNADEMNDLDDFISIVRELYIPDYPKKVHIKVFSAEERTMPGDTRWFGFNQTSTSVVSLFDNDDYLHPQFFHIFWQLFTRRPELDFALMQYFAVGDGASNDPVDLAVGKVYRFLKEMQFTQKQVDEKLGYPQEKYEELWNRIPTFGKEWWLGNTDAEPGWGNGQDWGDGGCHNGWSTFRRHVMEMIHPPVRKYGAEDTIWNYRIARAKMHYKCIDLPLGGYMKCHSCLHPQELT